MGIKPWEKARINIEFKDKHNQRINGWPVIYATTGTVMWQHVSKNFMVPPSTQRVDLFMGLLNCTGEVWFDEIKLQAFNKQDRPVKSKSVAQTNIDNWFVFDTKTAIVKPNYKDLSE
ncbi:hypothetical protein MHK_004806, partial [Candidatus Magnetomorum sp. HK-1]